MKEGEGMGDWDTECPAYPGGAHCVHWYDGEACCGCGDPPVKDDEESNGI